MYGISSSNESIYLKFGVNVLYTFFYRVNHAQIKIFILPKIFIMPKNIVKKYFFDFSKVHAIAASILIKNPFGFFVSHDQKG